MIESSRWFARLSVYISPLLVDESATAYDDCVPSLAIADTEYCSHNNMRAGTCCLSCLAGRFNDIMQLITTNTSLELLQV